MNGRELFERNEVYLRQFLSFDLAEITPEHRQSYDPNTISPAHRASPLGTGGAFPCSAAVA